MPKQGAENPQQLAAHPQHSIWVAASAGSGKTKVLTDRVLNLLLEGCAPERILCLTFTKAAAAEMANRVRFRLGDWAILPVSELEKILENLQGFPPSAEKIDRARTLFGCILDTPGGLKIQTIHGFCQSLLKRFPLEAGLSPFFEVANDTQRQSLLKNASHKMMESQKHHKLIENLILHFSEQTLEELHEFILAKRGSLKNTFSAYNSPLWEKHQERQVSSENDGDDGESALFHTLITHIPLELIKKNLFLFDEGSSTDQERGRALAQFLTYSQELKYQNYQEYISFFLTQKGEKRACLMTQKIALKSLSFKDLLEKEAIRLEKWLISYHAWEISLVSKAFLNYSIAFLENYENEKNKKSLLDYEDLILRTAALLKNPGCHWVLYKLDGGLDHILVDEAQDTSPSQWEVIRAIAAEFYENSMDDPRNRTLFIVGDGKQSIYSFQGADPDVFTQMQQDLSAFAKNSGKTWKDIELNISFRSTPQILALVDEIFSASALSKETLCHIPFRKDSQGLVEVWPLIREEKNKSRESWGPPVTEPRSDSPQKRLSQVIATKIKGWFSMGPLAKPILPGEILILVRRRTSFVDILIRVLKEHEIPVAGIDRLWLLDNLAVQDLLKIGEFLLLPEDDLTFATILKGPLCNLSEEDDLFDLAYGRDKISLWRRFQNSTKFDDIKFLLNDLLSKVDFLTPFALFSYILGPLEGRKKWQTRLGLESLDSLDEFLNICLNFQQENTATLQGFLHWVSQEVIELKRDMDQSNQVRIMTVHGSKGLQAPIIFLADTTQIPLDLPAFEFYENTLVWLPPSSKDTPLTKELKSKIRKKQQDEYNRLLYVALTRAEDVLYICGWEGRSENTWYDLITKGIQKIGEEIDFDAPSGDLKGKGWRLTGRTKTEVISHIPIQTPPVFILPSWLKSPPLQELFPQFMRPSEKNDNEAFESSDYGSFGTRRGVILHKLLETLGSFSEEIRTKLATKYLKLEKIPDDIAIDMIKNVNTIFKAFPELFGPSSQGEVPIMGKIGSILLSGQIDRLVKNENYILCIDFKTHTRIPHGLTHIPKAYWNQMAIYQMALSQIYPHLPIICGILWTHLPRLDILPDDILKNFIPSIDESDSSLYTKERHV